MNALLFIKKEKRRKKMLPVSGQLCFTLGREFLQIERMPSSSGDSHLLLSRPVEATQSETSLLC